MPNSIKDLPLSAKQTSKLSDDAKLIFGTIFSLRRMARQLGGSDDQFLSYRTGEYKLHYFETPTQLKLVMLTDTRVGNMRTVLHQIWATLYVEFVVKSPLAPVEHKGGIGVANELFEGGLESFIVSPPFCVRWYTLTIVLMYVYCAGNYICAAVMTLP